MIMAKWCHMLNIHAKFFHFKIASLYIISVAVLAVRALQTKRIQKFNFREYKKWFISDLYRKFIVNSLLWLK